ncbi:MAG TPA: hypothetical protein VMS40_21040 [Vicinamibacterales bacterium]|nr:hypothetical protein [Vicinamibacterales bacterium]
MATKYILAALSVVFLILAVSRMARGGGAAHPQSRTWLLIGVIFAAVSAWLFYQG